MRKITALLIVYLCMTSLFADDIYQAMLRGDIKAVKSYIEVLGIPIDTKWEEFDSDYSLFRYAIYAYEHTTKTENDSKQYSEIAKYLYEKGAYQNSDYAELFSDPEH